MRIQSRKMADTFVFWFHAVFIVAAVLAGLILSPWAVVMLVVLHRLHVFFFDGCLISKLQNLTGGLPEGMDFLQLAAKKIFRKEITLAQSRRLDYLFASLAVAVAFVR